MPTIIQPEQAMFCRKRAQNWRLQPGRVRRSQASAPIPPATMPTCIAGSHSRCSFASARKSGACAAHKVAIATSPERCASIASPPSMPSVPSSIIACGAVIPTRVGRSQPSAAKPVSTENAVIASHTTSPGWRSVAICHHHAAPSTTSALAAIVWRRSVPASESANPVMGAA